VFGLEGQTAIITGAAAPLERTGRIDVLVNNAGIGGRHGDSRRPYGDR
jgi:hypothetical protein